MRSLPLSVFSILALLSSSPALAAILDVGPSQTYATVGDALSVAVDGDVICVFASSLTEDITVDGLSLTLVGVGLPTWDFPPQTSGQLATIDVVNGGSLTLGGFDIGSPAGLYLAAYADVTSQLTVTQTRFRGTYLYFEGDATLDRVWITDLQNSQSPAVDNPSGQLTLVGSTFRNNVMDAPLIRSGGELVVLDSTFSGNEINESTVSCEAGPCSLERNLFTSNVGWFGAAVSSLGELDMVQNVVCGNDSFEGAVAVLRGTASLRNNAFLDNTSLAPGAALIAVDATVELIHNTFIGNTEPLMGAGSVFLGDGSYTLNGNVFVGSSDGPAVELFGAATITSDYNAWFDNPIDTVGFAPGPHALVGIDPELGAGTGCALSRLVPAPTSPLIDAGDPLLQDLDGSSADIGVTGGPDGF